MVKLRSGVESTVERWMCVGKANNNALLFVGTFVIGSRDGGGASIEGVCWQAVSSFSDPDWYMRGRWMSDASSDRIVWWLEGAKTPGSHQTEIRSENYAGVAIARQSGGPSLPEKLEGEITLEKSTAGSATVGSIEIVKYLSNDWQLMSKLSAFGEWLK